MLSLAYSPCPNDTYIFAAWTEGLLPDAPPVHAVLDDVEALNQAAREARYELTKASFGAIPYLRDAYRLLRSGAALGRGCGPLVVSRPRADGQAPALGSLRPHARVAIPGKLTTAYLLFQLAHPRPIEAVPMRFDSIVAAVAGGEVDAGLIIHESRFTYREAGLVATIDLGDWWERETGRPIPLGAILARRDLDDEAVQALEATIRRSLDFARSNDAAVRPYVRAHAFEMNEGVMRAHIALYVNHYTRDLGEEGMAAIETLFSIGSAAGLLPKAATSAFA